MIVPDTKDWTWVLERPCPNCGYDARRVTDVPAMIRTNVATWRPVLSDRDRPEPGTWSPLEYGCHVRDVFRLFGERLALMLREDDPLFANWDQDETAVRDRYAEQDPEEVAAALEESGHQLAADFARLTEDQWRRTGRRSDGAVFTVDTFARYLLHDLVHHHWDVAGVQAHA